MTRNLIISTDGTWNTPDQSDRGRIVPSNVVKTCRAAAGATQAGIAQLVYYDTGVGTGGKWDKIKGGMFGVGLSNNIKQAYGAIGREFQPEDKLFLFGFSRGAYTARSLSGLIGLCGVPDPGKGSIDEIVENAFDIYRLNPKKKREERERRARQHCAEFSHQLNGRLLNEIWFLGVWDTVGALGVPLKPLNFIARKKHKFHDTALGAHIKNAYHTVAIDERRRPFLPTLWLEKNVNSGQNVEQVWFPGVHTNIGGGYVDAGLSDRTFLWMCLKARNCGLGFDAAFLKRRVDPNYHGELRNSMNLGYWALTPVTRNIFGRWKASDDGNKYPAAGEQIHYSAKQRYEHVTEAVYRNGHAKGNLGPALTVNKPPTARAMQEEKEFHAASSINWNGDPTAPTPQGFS